MRFSTYEQRFKRKKARIAEKQNKQSEWHRHFAWWPRKVWAGMEIEYQNVWLEFIERRLGDFYRSRSLQPDEWRRRWYNYRLPKREENGQTVA